MALKGMTWSSIKRNPSLIPLFVVLGLGVTGATLYPIRCALKSPEVTWNKRKNPEPWNEYSNKQYKFITTPHSKPDAVCPAPKY